MKRGRFALALIVLTFLAASPPTGAAAAISKAGPVPGALQGFGAALDIGYCYDYLAPYGTWLTLDPYGYVWCPRNMGYGWRPYTDGHWIWSNDGWCWVSNYDWGWMPFHYGRWGFDNGCGWFWAPGTDWGPAWVFWRYSDLYCGWAPIPPGIAFGAGFDFDAFALGLPLDFWVFVNGSHFMDRDLRRFCLPYERNATVARLTRFSNRYEFRGGRMIDEGIGVDAIRRFTGHEITRYNLANSERPGGPRVSGDRAAFYRPAFRSDSQARPRQALSAEQARREMGPARIFEAPRGAAGAATESAMRKMQARERALLERSQAQERQSLQRRQAEESRGIRNPSERSRIGQEHQAQMAEQQRMFESERRQMDARHQREAETFRQAGQGRGGNPHRRR
jgi:hypothetical protein